MVWPNNKIAYHRLNTMTITCTIEKMDTMSEYKVCYATKNLDMLNDPEDPAQKQPDCT